MNWQITIYFSDGQKPFIIEYLADDLAAAYAYARDLFHPSTVKAGVGAYDDGLKHFLFRPECITRIELEKSK